MNAWSGVYTALVTPFRGGRVDELAYVRLLEEQVAAGVQGVVPVGTTGESPTVTVEEHIRLIELAVQVVGSRLKVIAGTGANSTAEAIHLTQEAARVGAHASLQVAPYYNKPTQAGLLAHFRAVARATELPIILYSIPGRCGIEIGVETVAQLAATESNIVAIKEAGGSVDRVSQLRQHLPDSFAILSGDDGLTLPFMSVGACGVISVASHLVPREMLELVQLTREGQLQKAEALHRRLYPLFRDLFIETNPVPVKAALALRGLMTDEVRLPLVGLNDSSRTRLLSTLHQLGL